MNMYLYPYKAGSWRESVAIYRCICEEFPAGMWPSAGGFLCLWWGGLDWSSITQCRVLIASIFRAFLRSKILSFLQRIIKKSWEFWELSEKKLGVLFYNKMPVIWSCTKGDGGIVQFLEKKSDIFFVGSHVSPSWTNLVLWFSLANRLLWYSGLGFVLCFCLLVFA